MRHFFAVLLSSLLVLPPGAVLASDCDEAVTVTTDTPAPCSGVAVPTEWALECAKCRDVDLPRCVADAELAKETLELDLRLVREELAAERELLEETQRLLELANPGPPRWFEHPAFLITLGFVIGTGTTVGIAVAVKEG